MKVSLIMTSRDRYEQVSVFMEALYANISNVASVNIEFIFLDQSQNSIFRSLFDCYNNTSPINVIYKKIAMSSLSEARNIGLKLATGDVYGFPDDDCVYPDNLLFALAQNLPLFDHYKCISFNYSHSKIHRVEKFDLPRSEILGQSISFSMFVKSNTTKFNESLGVGAFFGAGEESEYLLRLLEPNEKMLVIPGIMIFHPDFTNISLSRVKNYGLGFGALAFIMISDPSPSVKVKGLRLIFSPLIKCIINLMSLTPRRSCFELISFAYRLFGFGAWAVRFKRIHSEKNIVR